MEQTDYSIRRATAADAEALAQVHEATWRETYAGLMSGQMLDALTADAREAVWRRKLSGETGDLSTAYVAERDGKFVAFGSCGEQRDQALAAAGYAGEFTAVYVLKTDQRRGLGAGLMSAMMGDLAGRGLVGFTCWAPRSNIPARSLCEKLGGKLMGQREITLEHGALNEVAYGWPKA
ncbi:GNAT family N-acetyltransferase [Phenylobacterium sp. LjRoot225]|uniref:GNAT family N-acetyltransferase n=1 Tax=Phenylobacterium sp. LjRoot225 TaxID=3342285 RepID=UPI003ECD6F73